VVRGDVYLRAREKIISQGERRIVSFYGKGFALRFGSDLVGTIERGQRNSLSYFEGLAIEERPKMAQI
jgi:hypothetical protein